MIRYRITNWKSYQHYKDRNPPWIKLHKDLLTSKTWVMLDDASRVLAIASMLLAARNDNENGEFDGDPEFFQKVAFLNQPPNFARLVSTGFLEVITGDASNALATCTARREEKRREEKRRVENNICKNGQPVSQNSFLAEFEEAFAVYPHRQGDGDEKDKEDTLKKWSKIIKGNLSSGVALLACAKHYADECEALKRDEEYRYKITNFYGIKAYYKKYLISKPLKNGGNNEPRNKFIGNSQAKARAIVDEAYNAAKSRQQDQGSAVVCGDDGSVGREVDEKP